MMSFVLVSFTQQQSQDLHKVVNQVILRGQQYTLVILHAFTPLG
jgi:predicted N-formylglutamate amidohydrolase